MSDSQTSPGSQPAWQEDDSTTFIRYGDAITPSRAEHVALLTSLIPARPDEPFLAVDLACGAGGLSAAILERFPASQVVALDGSHRMLDEARRRLAPYAGRVDLRHFDLFARNWLDTLPGPARCFVSSMAIHHLDGPGKQRLFRDLYDRLEPGGALLILDLVEPVNSIAQAAYAAAWDAVVREQTADLPDGAEIYAFFQNGWNHFADPDLEVDKPSGLFEQLVWLREAGFAAVDCFWLRAGHALYGGYRSP